MGYISSNFAILTNDTGSLPDTCWCWPGERPHSSPGQPQGSPSHPSAAPALTMTPSRLRGRAVVIVGEGILVVIQAGVLTRLPRSKMCQGERMIPGEQ